MEIERNCSCIRVSVKLQRVSEFCTHFMRCRSARSLSFVHRRCQSRFAELRLHSDTKALARQRHHSELLALAASTAAALLPIRNGADACQMC